MSRLDAAQVLDTIFGTYDRLGDRSYGEEVTQTEHMLQSAWFATQAGASDALKAAALLHDYGHFVFGMEEGAAERGVDDRHEALGARALGQWFGPEVTQPIALHVQAKRCLCAVQPGYLAGLSKASQRSLMLQGGVMTAQETESFGAEPYAEDSVQLRRWDDLGKQCELRTPALQTYRPLLASLLRSHEG